jgi:hypothetical protein
LERKVISPKGKEELSKKLGACLEACEEVRYIKLGEKGNEEKNCLQEGVLRLGFSLEQADQYKDFNDRSWESIKERYSKSNVKNRASGNYLGQLRAAASGEDANALWITFSSGSMHWGFIDKSDGEWREHEKISGITRRLIGGWQSKTLKEGKLDMNALSGEITKSSQYRGTVCSVRDVAYLKSRLLGNNIAEVDRANDAKQELLRSLDELIRKLGPKDFELLVSLIFSSSGWRITSVTGETVKDIDLQMHLPSTGETALVQVKSQSNLGEFRKCIKELCAWDSSHLFWVCHSPAYSLADITEKVEELALMDPPQTLVVWGPMNMSEYEIAEYKHISEHVLSAGLVDWLIKRVA